MHGGVCPGTLIFYVADAQPVAAAARRQDAPLLEVFAAKQAAQALVCNAQRGRWATCHAKAVWTTLALITRASPQNHTRKPAGPKQVQKTIPKTGLQQALHQHDCVPWSAEGGSPIQLRSRFFRTKAGSDMALCASDSPLERLRGRKSSLFLLAFLPNTCFRRVVANKNDRSI